MPKTTTPEPCPENCTGRIASLRGGGNASIAQGVLEYCQHVTADNEIKVLEAALEFALKESQVHAPR